MEIWLRDLPEVPLLQFYNRTANNGHYWTNWPSTATDPYMNGIWMHTGFPYTMMQLRPPTPSSAVSVRFTAGIHACGTRRGAGMLRPSSSHRAAI